MLWKIKYKRKSLLWDILYFGGLLLLLPVITLFFILHKRYGKNLRERLGKVDIKRRRIWIHTASVGEALLGEMLLRELFKRGFPEEDFVFSFNTSTAREIFAKKFKTVKTFYLPFDLSNILERVIYQIKPSVLVLIEMELWPNLILCAKRYSVPIVVINSRISQTSLRYYRKFYGLFKELFEGIDRFCVADSLYMERLLALGVERKRIFQVGNIRYDQEVGFDLLQSIYFYRKLFCIHEGLKVLVAGSTHHPEEEMLLRLYKRLSTEEKIRMIIAPRHLERLDELIKCAQRYGLSWLRRSQLNGMSAGVDVIFIDTIGELAKIYSIADLVFVGGTIAPRGGHNLLEPARLGKPIICGASLYNFRDVAEGLLKQGGMRIIHSEEELFEQIQLLLRDSKLLKSMGLSCKEFSSSLRGALGRSVEVIEDCIKKA